MEQKPAFVVGVTGQMDLAALPEETRAQIRAAVRRVFQWLTATTDDPVLGPGLALAHTPRVLLTSLAPGADTLVAEVAKEQGCTVVAALPFPRSLYPQATTFATDEQRAAFAKWSDELGDRSFFVRLLEDENGDDAQLRQTLQVDLNDAERRHRRYRAAGEYVAAYSHVLLALTNATAFDGPGGGAIVPELASDNLSASSAEIMRVKREGLTRGLLLANPALTWADTGPVIHLYTPRPEGKKPNPPEAPAVGTITVLYPKDPTPKQRTHVCVAAVPPATEAEQAERERLASAEQFRRMAGQMDRFNRQAACDTPDPEQEAAKLLFGKSAPAWPEGMTPEHRAALGRLACVRRRASEDGNRLERRRGRVLAGLFLITLLAALLIHLAAHWHPLHDHEPADHATVARWIRVGLQWLALIVFVFGFRWFRSYRHAADDDARYDHRALAEGVRVQFYWAAVGLGESVSANYMQRQRSEMEWIRKAISSLSAPYHRWKDWFDGLTLDAQIALARAVAAEWIGGQHRYYRDSGYRDNHRLHAWHRFGLCLAVAGIVHAAVLCVWFIAPGGANVHPIVWTLPLGILGLAAYVAGVVWGWLNADPHFTGDPPKRAALRFEAFHGPWAWLECEVERRRTRLPVACIAGLVIAAATAGLCFGLPALAPWLPSPQALWITAGGAYLLLGALAVAWAEKNLLAEHARQYQASEALFAAGLRRIDGHLNAAATAAGRAKTEPASGNAAAAAPADATARAHLGVAQKLFLQLGQQALDEHAEWLMLHRARPLEPPMAG